jgi:acyl-CoA reductase-like NAD-dependent aldehyde dehydrogenase
VESLDIGLGQGMAMFMVGKNAVHFAYYSALARTREDGTSSEQPGVRTMIVREPLGVVGAINAWNFPSSLVCMKLAPALAAGNCIVIKPSSIAPVYTLELAKTIGELLPPGVLNVVPGPGSTTGQYVLDHPGIDKLSFTGSTEVGHNVALAAAKRIIPATLELGGKSAGIFFADMPQDYFGAAIGAAAGQAAFNAGQICAQESRLLIQDSIYDAFVEGVAKAFGGMKPGAPWDSTATMGPLSYPGQMEKVLGYVEIGKKEGARLVCGGERATEGELAKGNFIKPTLFADVRPDMRIAQEEIFGPVLSAIKFKDEAEAIEIANGTRYGLSGSVHTGDMAKALRVCAGVRTGTISVNGYTGRSIGGGAFGGFKDSGIGRENYITTLDAFSQLKTINFKYA